MEDFSLIILCERGRHLLPMTLDTLKSQKGSFEVLIFCEDRLGELSSLYPELKIRIEKPSMNRGEMMNRAIEKAKGTYVQFLESGDRYISQHGLAFLKELIQDQPPLIRDGKFFWALREKIWKEGGFKELCPIEDLLFRFEQMGIKSLVSPRVLIDSPHEPEAPALGMAKVLYRHFGVKRVMQWFFIENRPKTLEKMSRFIKQSFWPDE